MWSMASTKGGQYYKVVCGHTHTYTVLVHHFCETIVHLVDKHRVVLGWCGRCWGRCRVVAWAGALTQGEEERRGLTEQPSIYIFTRTHTTFHTQQTRKTDHLASIMRLLARVLLGGRCRGALGGSCVCVCVFLSFYVCVCVSLYMERFVPCIITSLTMLDVGISQLTELPHFVRYRFQTVVGRLRESTTETFSKSQV